MDVIVNFVGFEVLRFNDVLHLSYTYNESELTLTIITDTVFVYDMRDVLGVIINEK